VTRSRAQLDMVSLQAGTCLGPYEIVGLLGAGGMGEVYRARDPRLGRDVAVKILPPLQAAAPDRIERFAREARAAAALNHPNVLAVHDVGVAAEGPYLVFELLQGATLREALVPGRPWPVGLVLDVAVQIANGLAAAHARGIVHRDLKPENIFRCDDGVVKILDFGLARLAEPSVDEGESPKETLTREHMILGTLGYMAPEQVRGQVADHRADVFAFGALVYELLTGRRAFAGDTAADTMTAILSQDPADPGALASAPPQLARIVMRCLEKRPESRFQSASDLAFALRAISSPDTESGTVPAARRRRAPPRLVPLAPTALAVVVAAALGLSGGRLLVPVNRPPAPTTSRLTDFVGLEETPAMSPDGRSVAFTAGVAGTRQVFVRLITGGNPLQLTSTAQGCRLPRWSADSSSVLCFSEPTAGERQGSVWEVPALGGAARPVAGSLGEADVRSDGRLAYFRLTDHQIELVTSAADGSALTAAARFPPGTYYWHPRWSPDGRFVAFQRGDGVRFDMFVVPAAGGDVRQVTRDNTLLSGLSWLPDGRGIVYSSSRGSTMPYLPTFTLWEVSIDAGTSRRLTSPETSYVQPDVHQDGRVVAGRLQLAVDIWKFPVDASSIENVSRGVRVTRQTGQVETPTAGPTDDAVAFLSDSGGHANLWVIATATGEQRQITHERDPAVSVGVPLWSPDGRSITFVSSRGNAGLGFGIWTVNPEGGNLTQLVQRGFGAAWSADGRWIYYVERAGGVVKKVPAAGGTPISVRTEGARNVIGQHGSTLYYVDERPLAGGTPEFVIRAAAPEDGPSRVIARVPAARVGSWQIVNPALSPDGQWLAQPLTDNFTTNIWALPTGGGQWRQITDFGERVTFIARRVDWSRDGRFIYAAVADGDADVVLLDGVFTGRRW
jgi:eukaryotic-like serine/threonine-protein kinase